MMILIVLFLACIVLVIGMFVIFGCLLMLKDGWKKVTGRNTFCHVLFDWEEPIVVGEPVSFRVKINESKRKPNKIPPSDFSVIKAEDFMKDLYIEIRQALVFHSTHQTSNIEHVKEFNEETGEIAVKFSVRSSGLYIITVTYKGVRAVGGPFRRRFKPSSIDASKTVFLRPSPTIVCIAGQEITHEIQPRDRFGNDCDETIWQNTEVNIESRLIFIPKFADEKYSDCPVPADQISYVLITRRDGRCIEIVICVHKPGIFRGQILYDEKPINNGQFDILSITPNENSSMNEIANNNPAWTAHQALLVAVGEELQTKLRKAYLYISPKLFYVQEYVLKIFPIKIATYRVSPMTKIKMILRSSPQKDLLDINEYTFTVFDGIQPKLTLSMCASKARTLLALYFHFLRKRLGGSENFEGKQRVFYQELRGTMDSLRVTTKDITIIRANLVFSSMNATKYFSRTDWCKNFSIKFHNEEGFDYGGVRKEWLQLLCVQFFHNNEFGMFSSQGTSRLVHPTPATGRNPVWTLKHYEFAGKISGKMLFESACGDVYTQMVNARFSRSFLAQVLGLPPNYQHFEQDDPELYISKVKYIIENDVSEMELTFTEEEYDANGKLSKIVDLIPQGFKKPVTSDNKEQYLNALAQYRLASKFAKEIEAFKRGLHEIVPQELLSNFDENELELLMCGRSEFSIEDLKDNLVKDWLWGSTPNKLYTWFCTAVSNLSDDERARLLQFTTGSSLLPHGGFKALRPKFRITFSNDYSKLPKAHTCFNTICLSDHESFEKFEKSLRTSIMEGAEGFSFA